MADRDFQTRCGGKTLPRIISISKQPTDSNGYIFFFYYFAPFILMQRLQIMDSESQLEPDKMAEFQFSDRLNALGPKTQRGHSLDFFLKQLRFFLLLKNSLQQDCFVPEFE
jgi:hypothetical protein